MKIDDFQELTKLKWNYTEDDHRKMLDMLKEMGIDPGNFYQELEMSSRYVNTHRDVSYYNVQVNLHSHNYYEIIYCHRCADVEYLIGADRYRLQKGDIIYVPPGTSHRPILPENMQEPYERSVLWISREFMETIHRMFPDEAVSRQDFSLPIRTGGTRWEFLGDLFRAGVQEAEEKRPGWDAAVLGNTLTILANIKRAFMERTAGTMRAETPELPDRIMDYIEHHYAEAVSVDDLARKFYVSSSTVSHLFKQKMGVSLYRYITQRRLIAAKALIREGHLLESVGEMAGFRDYSAFYRAFRQEYGISPRDYRKLQEPQE